MDSQIISYPMYKSVILLCHPYVHCLLQACRKTCYQVHLMKDCGCYDTRYPNYPDIKPYSNIANISTMLPCRSPTAIAQGKGTCTLSCFHIYTPKHAITRPHRGEDTNIFCNAFACSTHKYANTHTCARTRMRTLTRTTTRMHTLNKHTHKSHHVIDSNDYYYLDDNNDCCITGLCEEKTMNRYMDGTLGCNDLCAFEC